MRHEQDPIIEKLLAEQRRDSSLREESLGPVVAAVGMVRESCATSRLLLDELECTVTVHLEVLDALLRRRLGNRWWEELTDVEEAR